MPELNQVKRMCVSNLLSSEETSPPQCPPRSYPTLPSMKDILAHASSSVYAPPSMGMGLRSSFPMKVSEQYTTRSFSQAPSVGEDCEVETQASSASPTHSGCSSPSSQAGEPNKRRERWTPEEHERFLEGLKRHGRKWKKIQACVRTKTAVQVRTHAYGFFAKLVRNMPEGDEMWNLVDQMGSLPFQAMKAPAQGKRRNEPKTDEEGMELLRRFVFNKKSKAPKATVKSGAEHVVSTSTASTPDSQPLIQSSSHAFHPSNERLVLDNVHPGSWKTAPKWSLNEAAISSASVMLDLRKAQ